jgi:hypothetical protein
MKKIAILALALFAAQLAFGQSDANQMKYVQLLAPTVELAATGTVTDVSAYKGNAAVAVQFSPSAVASTATVTFAHALASTGTWSTVTNAAGTALVVTQTGPATNAIQTVPIDMARVHKYVRAVLVQSGQDTNAVSAFLVAPMKSE